MRILITKDYDDMSRKAANIMSAQITAKPDSVLGLATGSTPVGMYKVLVERYQTGDLDFSNVKSVNLDEYVGLTPDNEQSYFYFMNEHLFKYVNISPENTHVPDGLAEDPAAYGESYDKMINDLGGQDMQLLGMGHNGHIGFNEPCDDFPNSTHLVNLAASTIQANARFFEKQEDVPTQALTMGIGTIFRAKKILLLVSGKDKAEIVKKALYGPVTPQVPASILQFHPDVTVVLDADAASAL